MDFVRTISRGKSDNEADTNDPSAALVSGFVGGHAAEDDGTTMVVTAGSDSNDGTGTTTTSTAATTATSIVEEETNNGMFPPAESSSATTAGVTMVIANTATLEQAQDSGAPTEIPPERDDANDPDGEVEEDDDDEEEDEYEYEDEDDAAFAGFLVDNPTIAAQYSMESEETSEKEQASAGVAVPAKIEEEEQQPELQLAKKQWREPSRAAVNMSLRAEKETSGSKRRLAQDLYRIMNKDTEETGFSLQPSDGDCMDKWTIRLFQFDQDSNLAKDMLVLGLDSVELEMSFPDQYPFEPPFVRVTRPRFKRQTGFVMNGALCMELLTKDGWNPINDIESVIVSIRSLLVVGEGRLEAAYNLPEAKYKALLEAAESKTKATGKTGDDVSDAVQEEEDGSDDAARQKRLRKNSAGDSESVGLSDGQQRLLRDSGSYSVSEAKAAYDHLSSYHKKKGWDQSGWWARKG